jgi:hypothetical protein
MKIVRLGIWGIIIVLFTLLASIPVAWATPEQSSLNQTLPSPTPVAISTEVVPPGDGTPTATPIPLLPPSGGAQGHGFFILTGVFLIGSALVLLLNAQRMGRQRS